MYLEYINEEQRQSQYLELETTEEIILKGTKHLIEWLEKQPHLPNVKGLNRFYINFTFKGIAGRGAV